MRLLDRYIIKTFWTAFLGALLVFSMSTVMLDYFSRIGYFSNPSQVEGTFAEGYSDLKIVCLFYLAYLPFMLKQVLPFVTVAAGLITVSTMLRRN